jgi:hypothetical protein
MVEVVPMIEVLLDVFVQQDVQAVVVKVVLTELIQRKSKLVSFIFFIEDICTVYPCANSGQCVPEGGSRRCVCSTPYYGDDCRDGKK